ncbi:MAG: InlB B-repeat-containing protein [Salinivirgaceae bacterium]|nr:InlB B-repeat-containing protein [Salinivirgaceae bacterium]
MNIKCLTPPAINSQTFLSVDKNIPVFVTCGNANVYKSTDYWSDFVTFIDNEFPYTIEVHSDDESMGNVTIRQQPSCDNTNAIIEATGTNGFIFSRWNDGNTENPRTIAVTQDTILTAFFEKYVTANISSSDNARGYTSNNTTIFKYGETITVSAIANKGYYFTQWSDGETANPRTLTLTEDVEFKAQFGVYQYKIVLQSNNPAMGNVSGSGTFYYNTTNTITATANPNHLFVNWSDGVTDNPRQMLLTKDTVITAIFAKEYNDLVVKSANTALGSVTGCSTIKYRETAEISATATAAHHHFVAWNDGNRQNPRQVTVERDTLFVATFGIDSFNIAATYNIAMGAVSGAGLYSYGSAAKVEATPAAHHHFVQWTNGIVQTAQEFVVEHDTAFEAVFAIDRHSVALAASDSLCGAVSGAGEYDYGAGVQLQATPAANCYFAGWSDGVTTNPRTLTVEGDTTIVAEFEPLPQFSIKAEAAQAERGTVSGAGEYVQGSQVTLSATAAEHYVFSQWADGRTDNPRTVRVIADATYTAVFEPMQYYLKLAQNNANMGMVSGDGVYSYGTVVSCLATPYPNYHFVQWSNGSRDNPYEFVVSEDVPLLTAYFAEGAVTAIGDESAIEPTIYAVGKTIVVENATDEICVYDAMGKLICRDAIHRVRAELRVNAAGVYIVKTGNVVMRVVVE